jgi:hypothetical protein
MPQIRVQSVDLTRPWRAIGQSPQATAFLTQRREEATWDQLQNRVYRALNYWKNQ